MSSQRRQKGDYCIVGGEKRLSPAERATLTGGEDLEKIIARTGSVPENLPGLSTSGCSAAALLQAIEFYSDRARLGDPAACFVAPAGGSIQVTESVIHGLKDGEVLDLSFRSAYQPQNPEYVSDYSGYCANQRVHARLWRHTNGRAPATLIAIHGWNMPDQRANALAFIPGGFYALGLDVALIELPFHMRRAPGSAPREAGSIFLSADLALTNEAISQSVSDLRQLRGYLEYAGPQETGCLGMSLGGYLASLWASLDDLAFCVPVSPVSSLLDMAWERLCASDVAFQVRAAGIDKSDLERAFRFHSPFAHRLRVKARRVLIVGGVDDKLLPTSQPEELWKHWGRPQLLWLSGGHGMQLREGRGFARVCEFLERALGLTGPS